MTAAAPPLPRVRGGDGPAVLFLHGFMGSAASWAPHARRLQHHYTTLAVDLPGHGGAVLNDEAAYTMPACVDALVATLDAEHVEQACVVGYSMGGRVALHLALAAPDRVSALVLESASPGLPDAAEREARRRADARRAAQLERGGVEAFVDEWERLSLFASQLTLPDDVRAGLRRSRLANDAGGLARSLRGMGAGAMEPVVDRLSEIAVPALFIVGALDARYVEIGERAADAIRGARVEIVEGAGHTVHLEAPAAFDGLLEEFVVLATG